METGKKRTFSNIARLVKIYRLEENLSQPELSEKLGYRNGQFVSNVERGLCSIPAHKVNLLSNAIKVPRERIVDAMVEDYKTTTLNIMNNYSQNVRKPSI